MLPLGFLQQQPSRVAGPKLVALSLLHDIGPRLKPVPPRRRGVSGGLENMLQAYYLGISAARIESWARFRIEHSLTHVYPLTDRRVLEFIYASPPELHVRHGVRRALFREAMRGVLPDAVRLAPSKAEDGRRGWLAGQSSESVRAGLLARVDAAGFPGRHPWVDLRRLRPALERASAETPLPVSVEHALAALTIWHAWGKRD